MSLDKGIEHKKEKRKRYRGAKAVDCTCRNHGSCPWCRETRTRNSNMRKEKTKYDCEQCFDTGCVCGGIGLSCNGCCDCAAARDIY